MINILERWGTKL